MATARHDAVRKGVVRSLVTTLQEAFEALQATVPPAEIESFAGLVHTSMSGPGRFYHRTAHVFDLFKSAKEEPTTALAALFHDIVYVQIDGILSCVRGVLEPFIVQKEKSNQVAETSDKHVQLVNHFFGFKPGQDLPPFGGQNEYLSCLVAVLKLRPYLSMEYLVAIIIAIEATVPFRGVGQDGLTWMERARKRYEESLALQGVSQPMPEETLTKYIQNATVLSNLDVAGFGNSDIRVFLSNTWSLLPESNPTLRQAGVFPIADYRVALWKTEKFLSNLNCDNIYHEYKGQPPAKDVEARRSTAKTNVRLTLIYLRCKLLALALVEAIAQATGGSEGPSALYLGDFSQGPRMEENLSRVSLRGNECSGDERLVLEMLESGSGLIMRDVGVAFDTDESRVAAMIMVQTAKGQLEPLFEQAKQFFDCVSASGATDLLRAFPRPVVESVCAAFVQQLPTRAQSVQALLGGL